MVPPPAPSLVQRNAWRVQLSALEVDSPTSMEPSALTPPRFCDREEPASQGGSVDRRPSTCMVPPPAAAFVQRTARYPSGPRLWPVTTEPSLLTLKA